MKLSLSSTSIVVFDLPYLKAFPQDIFIYAIHIIYYLEKELKIYNENSLFKNYLIAYNHFLEDGFKAADSLDKNYLPSQILLSAVEARKKIIETKTEPDWIKLPAAISEDPWSKIIFLDNSHLIKKPKYADKDGIQRIFEKDSIIYECSENKNIKDRWIYIIARGTPALDIYPIVEILADNKHAAWLYISSRQWLCYPARLTFDSAGIKSDKNDSPKNVHRIEIKYVNDGALPKIDKNGKKIGLIEDRNLFLSTLIFEAKEKDFE